MLVTFNREGGFANIPDEKMIDSDKLSKQEADELKQLVNATHFFDLPPVIGPSPSDGAADYYQYTLTIQDEGKQKTVHWTDLTKDPNLEALGTYLSTLRSTSG